MSSHVVTILASLMLLVGCSPIKGYSGPDLPDDKLSFFFYESDSDLVSLFNASVGDKDLDSRGIAMLPGNYNISVNGAVRGHRFDCKREAKLDDYNFQICRMDRQLKKTTRDCRCYDYLSLTERCKRIDTTFNCLGTIKSLAGNRYSVDITAVGKQAAGAILNLGTKTAAASMMCKAGHTTGEDEERDLGTGKPPLNDIDPCRNW